MSELLFFPLVCYTYLHISLKYFWCNDSANTQGKETTDSTWGPGTPERRILSNSSVAVVCNSLPLRYFGFCLAWHDLDGPAGASMAPTYLKPSAARLLIHGGN